MADKITLKSVTLNAIYQPEFSLSGKFALADIWSGNIKLNKNVVSRFKEGYYLFMTDETKKTKERPILDLIFRLINVYLATTFFFKGWREWQNEEYLLAISWFIFTLSQIGQIFGWHRHKSRLITWTLLASVGIALFIILSKSL